MQTIDSMPTLMRPHVLVVSNHWEAKKSDPSAGVFVDRQIASLQKAGVRINTFDIGLSHSLIHIVRKWLELRRLVRKLNPDLVHGRYGTIVGFAAAFAGRPAVISFVGGDLLPGASISLVRLHLGFLLSNLAALRAKRLICVSEELRQALWWRKSRAIAIPDEVDLDLFSPGPQEIARKQLGWELSHPIVIMNVRNAPKAKGLDLATTAMQMVRSRIPGTEFRLIENVEPNKMPLYYRAADALVCASLSEGSPNVVKEALACNLPVVSTPVGDVPERLAGVQPSAVVARDAKAIGDALVKILLERKRSNGREHVASLSSENIAQRVLDVYRTALRDRLDKSLAEGTHRAEEVTVIPITDGDMLQEVARLHLDAFAGYLNCSLGRNYIRAFIRWFIGRKDAIVIAAVGHDQQVVGYAIGAPVGYDTIHNRELVWVVAAAALLHPWLFFRPSFWRVVRVRLLTLLRRRDSSIPCCELPEPRMSLVAMGVGRSWQGRGVGLLLMQGFLVKARELKMRSLVLSVLEDQTPARAFYEKCGWRPCVSATGIRVAMKYCRRLDLDAQGYGSHHADHGDDLRSCEQSLQPGAKACIDDSLTSS